MVASVTRPARRPGPAVCHSWAMDVPPTQTAAVRDLIGRLEAARDAADRIADRSSLGLRAVEAEPGRRSYVAAFEGPAFLCLAGDLTAETSAHRARQAASASLLWEYAEARVDAEALRALVQAIGRLLALGGEPAEVAEPLEVVAARALELAAWRDDPLRAVASVPDLDVASRLQERLVGAYARFVRASDPLVERQDSLDPELIAALRAVEEAAGAAGAGERLAEQLARALEECDEGAGQMVAANLVRLHGE